MAGSFDMVDFRIVPTPIAETCLNFLEEQNPSLQLLRLIDCFEVVLKYATTICIQSFYAEQLQDHFSEVDALIRQKIQRPSLGDYAELVRKLSSDSKSSFRFGSRIREPDLQK